MRLHRAVWASSVALLLAMPTDPASAAVKISNAPTANMSCSADVCTPTAPKAVLNVSEAASFLASGDLKIVSDSATQDIVFETALSWVSTSRLTLQAYRSVIFYKPLVVAGSGALTLTVNTEQFDGELFFLKKGHVEFWDQKSNLIINGHEYYLLRSLKTLINVKNHPYVAFMRSSDASKYGTFAHAPIPVGGSIEGLGNTIFNLSINDSTDGENVGLMGQNDFFGDPVRNLNLVSAHIVGSGANQNVGIFAGRNDGTIVHCSASGTVSGGANSRVGGIAGISTGGIWNSFANVSVSGGAGSSAGGLVGENSNGFVRQSFANGNVMGGDSSYVGGLVGKSEMIDNFDRGVFDSYATGSATGGNSASVGGLVGLNLQTGTEAFVWTSYSTGAVTGGTSSSVGGLIGTDQGGPEVIHNYWDMETSGIADGARGAGNVQNDPGITGLTTAQLKAGLPEGFDRSVWHEKAKVNQGYPYLLNLPPQ